MTAEQWSVMVLAGAAVVFVISVFWVALSVRKTMAELQKTVEQIRPLITDVRAVLSSVDSVAKRSDELLATATSVTDTVDSASKLAYNVFSNPVIKAAALASGIGRGIHVLREKLL